MYLKWKYPLLGIVNGVGRPLSTWVVYTRKLSLRGPLEMDLYTEFASLSFSGYLQLERKLMFATTIHT